MAGKSSPAAKAKSEKTRRPRGTFPVWTAAIGVVLVGGLAVSFVFGVHELERFLIRDARFRLPMAAEYGEESPNLHIQGLRYASRERVTAVFNSDVGRSVFLLPLSVRRESLQSVPWVKDAVVIRTWPNHVTATIVEREPVAYIEVPADSMSRWYLIDDDGVVLDPPRTYDADLPMLTGIRPREDQETRKNKVHRSLKMLAELGELKQNVSDVDATDITNLKITAKQDGRAVRLLLGDRNYQRRYRTFLDHYEGMRNRIVRNCVVDLQTDGHIYVLRGKHAE